MIRLDRVELLHWDMQPHQVLPLARGVTLLTGENGVGKTSILDALKIALGASRLDGDRTIDGYLAKQSKPVVMIRVLADNRPAEGTRRRPFDRLGDISSDLVTLGVVFRADDTGAYAKDYFLVGGDVVPPLDSDARAFRFLSPTEYRSRLEKVGITARYLKLLTLPQGKIAELCRRSPVELFDDLYDIIGGRHALEEWRKRLEELAAKQKEHEATRGDLESARNRLEALGARARRHQEWLHVGTRLSTLRAAIPYAEFRDARAKTDQLMQRVQKLTGDYDQLIARKDVCRALKARVDEESSSLSEVRDSIAARVDELNAAWRSVVEEEAQVRARLSQLAEIRNDAQGVSWQDLDVLEADVEAARVRLTTQLAAQATSLDEKVRVEDDLNTVRTGIMPLPASVEVFREALRTSGIAHHLLYEVIDVEDEAWQHAVEGVLGRHRFAIVLNDAEAWPRAAALARKMNYGPGVLVPDVRSHSTADGESAFRLVRVHDDSHRALIARFLRPLSTGDHPDPLVPSGRTDVVSPDGFVVSKVEAYAVQPGDHVIGRAARVRRERELTERLQALVGQHADLERQVIATREAIEELEGEIDAQRRLRAWELVHDEFTTKAAREAELRGTIDGLEASRKEEDGRLATIQAKQVELGRQSSGAEHDADGAESAARTKDTERAGAATELAEAETLLGTLMARPLEAATAEVTAVLEETQALRTIQALEKELTNQEQTFTADERDRMLPVNHQRQEAEVAAVEGRLRLLGDALEQTRQAAERAQRDYQQTTRVVFRGYFARLAKDAAVLDFHIDGGLEVADTGQFRCDVRVRVADKLPVGYASADLSGGQKAALSILMAMTAVSLESDGAGFFLVDEPFSASDVIKMNELGQFLARSGAQYLVSMPTSADLAQCGPWLSATWTCTKSRGGFDVTGKPVLAPRVKIAFTPGARDA